MPDRISPTTSLAETLRALARNRVGSTRPSPAEHDAMTRDRLDIEANQGIEPLRQRLMALVRNLDTSDPDAVASVRDSALQEIVLWEFGSDFRQDAQFRPMLDAIGKAMENDEAYHAQFTRLLSQLQQH